MAREAELSRRKWLILIEINCFSFDNPRLMFSQQLTVNIWIKNKGGFLSDEGGLQQKLKAS